MHTFRGPVVAASIGRIHQQTEQRNDLSACCPCCAGPGHAAFSQQVALQVWTATCKLQTILP